MSGLFFPRGAQLRIPRGALTIRVSSDGAIEADPLTPETRMDMWPQWLHEALDGAIATKQARRDLAMAAEAVPNDPVRLGDLLDHELRASMRAVTASAFAVDAFYASVRARGGEHPDRAKWRTPGRRTPRHVQVFETLRYQLKLRSPGANEMQSRIKQLFKFRGWAVHADSTFRAPLVREDLGFGVDWHYAAFREENATTMVFATLQMLDIMVSLFPRGANEIQDWQVFARERLDEVLDRYDASGDFPPIDRTAGDAAPAQEP